LEPEQGEIAVSHPCALEVSRTIYMFFASDVGGLIRIAMATSSDGLSWGPPGHGPGARRRRARFLPKWHDLCGRTLGRQLDAAPDLERLHALRDGVAGFSGPPERLDRRSPTPPPQVPQMLSVESARWAVDAARRVVEEFHQRAGRERPDWLDWAA
jgi:hypothetical protein